MKTPKQELREILSSVEAIKTDLERPEYGATVTHQVVAGHTRASKFVSRDWKTQDVLLQKVNPGFHPERVKHENIIKYEQPLRGRHVRMYCATNREKFHCFTEIDKLTLFKFGPKKSKTDPLEVIETRVLMLDMEKDFEDQSEEFFEGMRLFFKS